MKELRKNAVILTADKFEDMEVFFPLFRLTELNWNVDIAAPNKQPIHDEQGYRLSSTLTFNEVDPDNYDLLIIPVGFPDVAPSQSAKLKRHRILLNHSLKIISSLHLFVMDPGLSPPPML